MKRHYNKAAHIMFYRTQTLYYAYAVFISTELLGPPLASVTSRLSLWAPLMTGLVTLLSCYVVLFLMPESQPIDATAKHSSSELGSDFCSSFSTNVSRLSAEERDKWGKPPIVALFRKRDMIFALPIFLVGVFRGISLRILPQYVSIKYGWRLEQVGCLVYRGQSASQLIEFPDERYLK